MNSSWNETLGSLELDVQQILKQAAKLPQNAIYEAVEAESQNIETYCGTFGVSHDRTMQIIRKKDSIKSRAASALFYWARQYLLTSKSFVEEFMALQSRKMWLRLLQARFADTRGDEQVTLEARHLVDLVQRRQQLVGIEEGLRNELSATIAFRATLRKEYESIGAADENWKASGSMAARLGVNLQDTMENPSTVGLKDLMKVVAVPLRHPNEAKALGKLGKDLTVKSDKLIERCNDIARRFVKEGPEAVNKDILIKFKNDIVQIEDLNQEAHKKYTRLIKERIVPCRPKVVLVNEKL